MKVSVIAPVKNEFPWIGYSVKAAIPYVHEFIYALSPSIDGTDNLLEHLKTQHDNITVIPFMDFHPLDQKRYNEAFNICIEKATGDACFFLHPDMIITEWKDPIEGSLAWTTEIKSYAGGFKTQIVKGRASTWKNIHAKKFGLHYFGGYGSQNEDFYHSDITGNAYRHYGTEVERYPYEVASSGIKINHYCELKSYARRLEKMKFCLKTQLPDCDESRIEELAIQHPRVTLAASSSQFGNFQFEHSNEPVPDVVKAYEKEFSAFGRREVVHG